MFPDALPFLEQFKSKRLAILTNGQRDQQDMKLQKTGIDHYFEFVVTVDDVGVGKPHPKIFDKACQLAGLRPDQITYIGDNLQKDALAAAQAGMNGVWLNRNGKSPRAGVSEIKSLADFSQ